MSAEGFRIYIPSRAALEALESAVSDELTRTTDHMKFWTNREQNKLAIKMRSRADALLVALMAIKRQDG